VAIIGVGLHPFGRFPGKGALSMGAEAARAALADAGLTWADMQFAVGGSYEVDQPDALVSELGLTGVQFTNVYNGCATAGSALAVASQAIRLGEYEIGLVVGMDKHDPGAFTAEPTDYGCPPYLRSVVTRTRRYGAFEVHSPSAAPSAVQVPAPTVDAAARAYELAGAGPAEVGIAQLQDTDAGAEVMHMAECGLCKDGEQNDLIASGATALSGRLPVNTDGGLIANGEPVGASGLRQVHELVTQLRGRAGQRQVANTPKVALAQLYGAPGVAAVSVLTT
jgi:acetyl-CoA acetyltransferase